MATETSLRHDGLLYKITERRMMGKPTRGRRRLEMTHNLTKGILGSCEASRFDSNSKVAGRFEIFESAAPAVVPQTTLTVQQKTSTFAPL